MSTFNHFVTELPPSVCSYCRLLLAVLVVAGVLTANPVMAQQTDVTHTVKKGETLFSIAQEYNVTVKQIRSWNDLTSETLQAGQTLRIRPSGQTTGQQKTSTPSEQEKSSASSSTSSSYYVVKSGDTLYEIANDHDMTVAQLKSLNDLTSNNIRVGQRLLVAQPTPTPSVAEKATGSAPQGQFMRYTLSSGESWNDLTQKFQMDSVELAGLNPETDPADLFDGKKITVLKPPSVTYQNPYRIDAQLQLIGTSNVARYSDAQRGTPTSSGELYNPRSLTAAHPSISLGSIVYVVNQQNRRGVFVKVNDRSEKSALKLSDQAYEVLQFAGGNSRVQIFKRP